MDNVVHQLYSQFTINRINQNKGIMLGGTVTNDVGLTTPTNNVYIFNVTHNIIVSYCYYSCTVHVCYHIYF